MAVLVTGAGGGIGMRLARAYAGKGRDLFLADIDEEGLRKTVEEALDAGAGKGCL